MLRSLWLILIFTFSGLGLAQNDSESESSARLEDSDYPVITFELVDENSFHEVDLPLDVLEQFKTQSRQDVEKLIPIEEVPGGINNKLEYRGAQILLPRTSFFPPTPQSFEAKIGLANIHRPSFGLQGKECDFTGISDEMKQISILDLALDANRIIQKMEDDQLKQKKFNPGQIYIFWGYQRGWHSKSDVTFRTNEGTFTIYDAVGRDRPSYKLSDYIQPSKILIPQYNLRIGYQLNPKWSIEGGVDHMKWVFDNSLQYRVEGDFSSTVYVRDPNNSHNLFGLNFDQVKESGDMSWLKFEHTDGYNYAFVGTTYTQNLLQSRNQNWKLDGIGGAGLGLMVPRTDVSMHRDGWWNFDSRNNNWKVAGYGVHAEGKMRVSYKNIFAEASGRYTGIKIDSAPVNNRGDTLSHTPIHSFQFIFGGGVFLPLGTNKPQKKF
jgi:hypothetical protein